MAKDRPSKRLSDIAVIAPIFGFILLIPPVIGLFATDAKIFGAPMVLVYLFAVWLGLIVVAVWLGRRLSRLHKDDGA